MQVSEARYRATAFLQTLVIPNSVQVREGKGAFHSTKIAVWNLGNFMCPVERYIRVARTRLKPLHFLLLYLQTGSYRWVVVGTTILSNGQAHFGSPTQPTEITRPVNVDHLQRWSQISSSDRTALVRSIWFLIEYSGILGWMESVKNV